MAILTQPMPWWQVPPEYRAAVVQYSQRNQIIARKFSPLPPELEAYAQAAIAQYEAAAASWNVLQPWKKLRWAMCAINTYGIQPTMTGKAGVGGYTMYIQAYMTQATLPGKQPISPCSAHALDPANNPHNFQP